MDAIIKNLQTYLLEILRVKVRLSSWKKRRELPFFLTDSYDFYETVLLKQPCLFVVSKKDNGITPKTIKKHLEQVQKKSNGVCVFVQMTTTSYNRKRFIEHQIPFVIPGNQMYLPQLGLDLREYFRAKKKRKKSFSPATQAVIIRALLSRKSDPLTPSELSQELDYTLMTMSRAFDELQSAGIGQITRKGKERLLFFEENRHKLWEKVKLLMRDPVKKRVWIKGKKPKIKAGLDALAQDSMLVAPSNPIYAVDYDEWKKMDVIELPNPEEAAYELEIWCYNPGLFARKRCVDPFSLYLSLYKSEDIRVEAALDAMIEKIEW